MDRIESLEEEIAYIRQTLTEKENELYTLKQQYKTRTTLFLDQDQGLIPHNVVDSNIGSAQFGDKLARWAIERYSRQILLPDIGVSGQERVCSASVLIVGAGALGCPSAAYLAGAGVGEIGIVDYDTVEITNIHRQILHGERDENTSKVQSAANKLRSVNSKIKVTPYQIQLDSSNALQIINKYDIILDCTDNVPTRYLLNDACVLSKKPLISGSALKMEGQITIYGYRSETSPGDNNYVGPCYRCLFPTPPPSEAVGSCSANGVAGPVPGVIGCLQALEAIKYIVGHPHSKLLVERMVLFDGEDCTFRTVKLRPKNPQCAACSDQPTITRLIDYETFCKAQAKEKDLDLNILPAKNRISATDLASLLQNDKQRHLLIDVRSTAEFNMCKIDGAVNYPIESLRGENVVPLVEEVKSCSGQAIFICRRGNDSQLVAQNILNVSKENSDKIKDVIGGLHAWSRQVDNTFPVY